MPYVRACVGTISRILTSMDTLGKPKAVLAEHIFEPHEILDEKLGPGFSDRVGGK